MESVRVRVGVAVQAVVSRASVEATPVPALELCCGGLHDSTPGYCPTERRIRARRRPCARLEVALICAIYDASVMRRLDLLLRLVLCVSLVLDGSSLATASAGVSTHHAPAALSAAALRTSDDQGLPCPDHAGMRGEPSQGPADLVTLDDDPKPAQSSPDCCKAGTCVGTCLVQSAAAVSAFATPEAVIAHGASVRVLAACHTSRIPHPAVRPPIG